MSEDSYTRGEKRSLISLQMCFMASAVEMLAMATAILSGHLGAHLQELQVPNIHFPDAIVMSIVIPLLHLLNQEITKGIIFESGWCNGFRYIFNVYIVSKVDESTTNGSENPVDRSNRSASKNDSSTQHSTLRPLPKQFLLRRCNSSVDISLHPNPSTKGEIFQLRRCHSFKGHNQKTLTPSLSTPIRSCVSTSIEIPISYNSLNLDRKNISRKNSITSITTIYLET